MTQKTWHRAAGTLFGFPALPPEEDWTRDPYAKILREQAAILETAAKVRYRKPSKPRPPRPPKPGDGHFAPKPGQPGSLLEVDGRQFEVWADAPAHGGKSVWAVCEGRYYVINRHGHYAKFAEDVAKGVVDGYPKHRVDAAAMEAARRAIGDAYDWQKLKAELDRAVPWARAKVAHQLYPDRYPDPGDFAPAAESAAA